MCSKRILKNGTATVRSKEAQVRSSESCFPMTSHSFLLFGVLVVVWYLRDDLPVRVL